MRGCEICGSTKWAQTYKGRYLCRKHGYRWTEYGDANKKLKSENKQFANRCDYCGEEYFIHPSKFNRSNNHYCSLECYGKNNSGENSPVFRHGMSYSKLYGIWSGMIQRCCNEKSTKYKDYGGRGIVICQEWKTDFIAFREWSIKNGYSDKLEIDRINNNGNYDPNNCRFVTRAENCRNQRRSVTDFNNKKRKCSLCEKVYDISLFVKHKGNPLDRGYQCYPCYREIARANWHIKHSRHA